MTGEFWTDPNTGAVWRWDGYQWVQLQPAQPARRTYFGALLMVVSVIAGLTIVFWPIHVSVLGTSVDCGTPIAALTMQDPGTDASTSALVQECKNDGGTHVLVAVVVLLVGVGAGGGINRSERRRT